MTRLFNETLYNAEALLAVIHTRRLTHCWGIYFISSNTVTSAPPWFFATWVHIFPVKQLDAPGALLQL